MRQGGARRKDTHDVLRLAIVARAGTVHNVAVYLEGAGVDHNCRAGGSSDARPLALVGQCGDDGAGRRQDKY